MSNFFHNFILDEEQREETFSVVDIAFWDSDMYPLLTCNQYDDIEAYYLFNRIKIWQKSPVKNDNKSIKDKLIMFLLSVLLVVSIPLGLLYEIHSNEVERDNTYYPN